MSYNCFDWLCVYSYKIEETLTLSLTLFLSLTLISLFLSLSQVMQTSQWLYLVMEYASGGEIFGMLVTASTNSNITCVAVN